MSLKVLEIINDKIVEYLFECKLGDGVPPWHRNWMVIPKRNGKSNRVYNALNRLLLSMDPDNFYYTWNNVKELGGSIKEGFAKQYRYVLQTFPKTIRDYNPANPSTSWNEFIEVDKKTGKKVVKRWSQRYFRVYPWSMTEGINKPEIEGNDNVRDEHVEAFIQRLKDEHSMELIEDGNQPCYNFDKDRIEVPVINQHESAEGYYHNLFHEIAHWTGHKSRLSRDMVSQKKDKKKYAREELAAEIASACLCHIYGMDMIPSTVSYIDGWIEAIKGDVHLLNSASSKAEKILKFLKVV